MMRSMGAGRVERRPSRLGWIVLAIASVLAVGCDAGPEETEIVANEALVEGGSSLEGRLDNPAGESPRGEPGGDGGLKFESPASGDGILDPQVEPDPLPWKKPTPHANATDA